MINNFEVFFHTDTGTESCHSQKLVWFQLPITKKMLMQKHLTQTKLICVRMGHYRSQHDLLGSTLLL